MQTMWQNNELIFEIDIDVKIVEINMNVNVVEVDVDAKTVENSELILFNIENFIIAFEMKSYF